MSEHGATTAKGTSVHGANDPASAAMKLWRPPLQTHDDAWLPERDQSVAKSDDAIRNNPMLQGGIRSQIDQVVGDHYRMSYDARHEHLVAAGMSDSEAVTFADAVEEQFDLDARSLENWFDASGRMNLTEMCGCAMYTHYRQGESIQIAHYLSTAEKRGDRPFATAVQIVNPDRVISPFAVIEDRYLRAGFRHNKRGYAIGMHVLNRHPNEVSLLGRLGLGDEFQYITRHTPWGRSKWQHLRLVEAADQTRGRSGLIAGLKKERMLSKFEETMLSNAITRAFYAAVIESDDPKTAFEGLALQDTPNPNESALDQMALRAAYYQGENELTMNDSTIAHLYKGDTMKLLTPDGQVDFMDPFTAIFMRYLARTLDISYEELSGDYTKTNYSGSRAGKLQSEASRRAFASRSPEKFGRFMGGLWLEENCASARLPFPGRTSRARLNRFLEHKERLCQFIFSGPGTGHIDPVKGTEAAMNELKMGATTLKRYCATYLNADWREIVRQRAEEYRVAGAQGLDLNAMLGIGAPAAPARTQRPETDDDE